MSSSNNKKDPSKQDRRKVTELNEGLPEYWVEDQWYQDDGDSGDND